MSENLLRMKYGIKRIITIAIISLILPLFVAIPIVSAHFFDTIGQSARPLGLGEVFLLSSGDANGFWYNPSSLGSDIQREVAYTYALLYPGLDNSLSRNQLNYVQSLGPNSGLGVGLSMLSTQDAGELALAGSYGYRMGELNIGASLKILRWAVDGSTDPVSDVKDKNLSNTAFSLDIAGSYHLGSIFGLGDFTFGLFARDANMPNISENGDDSGQLPVNIGLGILLNMESWSSELDISKEDDLTRFSIGGEYVVPESSFLVRGGVTYSTDFISQEPEGSDVSLGIGYRFPLGINFDCSYVYPFIISETGGRTYISLGKGL